VPASLGGMRLDQALAQLFPQYSRNRLQVWLKSGHITIDGELAAPRRIVDGGERVLVEPPPAPDALPNIPDGISISRWLIDAVTRELRG